MNIKAKLLIFSALAVLSLAVAGSVKAENILTVGQSEQPAGRDVASPADNISFFNFSLTNNSDEAINLDRLVINNVGTSGEQVRSAFSSLTLYSQIGNVVSRTSVRSGRNGYAFTNFNRELGEGVVPNDGRTYHYGIHATVNNRIDENLTIKLALNSVNSFRATGAESRSKTQVTGNLPIQGNDFTITADGDNGLGTITARAENNPMASNVVAGTAMVPVLNVSFIGSYQNNRINSLRFAQINEGMTRSVDSLTIVYRNEAGENVSVTRSFDDRDYATFSLYNNPLYVSNNGASPVSVYANLAAINHNFGAYSGDQLKFAFLANQGFSARNYNNRLIRSAVAENNQLDGNIMVVHGTLPTIAADSAHGNLDPGTIELYRFRVYAAEGTDLSLKKLSLRLALDDSVKTSATLTLTDFRIYEGSNYNDVNILTQGDGGANTYQIYNGWGATSTVAHCGLGGGRLSDVRGQLCQNIRGQGRYGAQASSTHDIIVVFNDDRLIPAGQSRSFILKATATNVDSGVGSNDSATTYAYDGDAVIGNEMYLEATCDYLATNGRPGKYCLTSQNQLNDLGASMIWSDNTGTNGDMNHLDIYSNTSTPSADWFNGWKVRGLEVRRTLD